MRIKMYPLIEQIVDEGIEAGWNYAHKHTDNPIKETIKHCIEQYIMQGFDEMFIFEQEEV